MQVVSRFSKNRIEYGFLIGTTRGTTFSKTGRKHIENHLHPPNPAPLAVDITPSVTPKSSQISADVVPPYWHASFPHERGNVKKPLKTFFELIQD